MTETEDSLSEPPPAKRLKLDKEEVSTSINTGLLDCCDDSVQASKLNDTRLPDFKDTLQKRSSNNNNALLDCCDDTVQASSSKHAELLSCGNTAQANTSNGLLLCCNDIVQASSSKLSEQLYGKTAQANTSNGLLGSCNSILQASSSKHSELLNGKTAQPNTSNGLLVSCNDIVQASSSKHTEQLSYGNTPQANTCDGLLLSSNDTVQATASYSTGLLQCCDDLLLEIFSYVEHTDLLSLSQCCERLHRVVFDRTLWVNVDLRNTSLVAAKLQQFIKFFLPTTKLLAIKGPWENRHEVVFTGPYHETETVTVHLLETIAEAAPNLTSLILEGHIIDSKCLDWDKVPHNLENLSLKMCHLIKCQPPDNNSNHSFFFRIDECLPHLKRLDLSYCRWFEPHSLMALSKCKQLQELRLPGCELLDLVPYISLSTRFGFQALTVVDLRWSRVTDREVSCFSKTATLQELYLEALPDPEGSTLITDMAITSFGGTLEGWRDLGYIVVIMPQFQGFMPSALQVVQMSKYIGVTDTSLRHCSSCLKSLRHINVCSTSVTQEGILKFRSQRPDVTVECDYDLDVQPTSSSGADNS